MAFHLIQLTVQVAGTLRRTLLAQQSRDVATGFSLPTINLADSFECVHAF